MIIKIHYMFNFLVKIIVNTPVYPHWLENLKMNSANERMLKELSGDILEVGAGDGSKKEIFLNKYKGIKKYLATDYSSWDDEFVAIDKKVKIFGGIGKEIFGYKERIKLDQICSATSLPFADESFDYHLSFQVLEHIDDPDKYFSEAARVVRKSGHIILSVPFLYRMHGGEPLHKLDFFRYLNGFFYMVAERNNLEVLEIYSNTGCGSAVASIINQWLIRRIVESNFFVKFISLFLSPFIFLAFNLLGFLVDIAPDKRFSTHFYINLIKK